MCLAELSRSRLKALILAGQVSINSSAVKNAPVRDPVIMSPLAIRSTIYVPEPIAAKSSAEDIVLYIVYEDDDIIVIDKPSGLVAASGCGPRDRHAGDVSDRRSRREPVGDRRRQAPASCTARQGYDRIAGGGEERPRPRIARPAQFCRPRPHRRDAARRHGLRLGGAERERGTIDAPIVTSPGRKWREGGREAITHWDDVPLRRQAGRRLGLLSSRRWAPIRSGCIWPISATP